MLGRTTERLQSHTEPGFTVINHLLAVYLTVFIRVGYEIGCIQQINDWFVGHTDKKKKYRLQKFARLYISESIT